MASKTLTRNMSKTLDLEKKLQNALEQLKSKNTIIEQLIEEREDHEKEMEKILTSNKNLKKELAELDISYMDMLDQRDHLQRELNSLSQCTLQYEQALDRIQYLEQELEKTRNILEKHETNITDQRTENTLALYDELIEIKQDQVELEMKPYSKRVRKKIKKIQKCIKNATKNKNILLKINRKLRNERSILMEKLKITNSELKTISEAYVSDTQALKSQIDLHVATLESLTIKYELAKNQIKGHISAAEKLLELSTFNADRFDSLVKNYTCTCASVQKVNNDDKKLNSEKNKAEYCSTKSNVTQETIKRNMTTTIVFSDEMGKNLGSLMQKQTESSIFNNCLPQRSFRQIIEIIKTYKFSTTTSIILAVGNSLGTTYKDIVKGMEYLSSLNVEKIIVCSFPYSANLTRKENERIYYLNNLLYKLTACHDDNLFLLDTNNFISNLVLTKDTLYLPKKYIRQLATLLIYNLQYFRKCNRTIIPLFNNCIELNQSNSEIGNSKMSNTKIFSKSPKVDLKN